MENNITKIPIKNSGKGVTLPLNSWKRGYGPPPLVLTFTDDPPLWGPSPSPPPPKKKRTFPKEEKGRTRKLHVLQFVDNWSIQDNLPCSRHSDRFLKPRYSRLSKTTSTGKPVVVQLNADLKFQLNLVRYKTWKYCRQKHENCLRIRLSVVSRPCAINQ